MKTIQFNHFSLRFQETKQLLPKIQSLKLPPQSSRPCISHSHALPSQLCFSSPPSWMSQVIHLVYSLLSTSVTLPLLTPYLAETLLSPLPSNTLLFLQSLWWVSWSPHPKRSFSFPFWNPLEFTATQGKNVLRRPQAKHCITRIYALCGEIEWRTLSSFRALVSASSGPHSWLNIRPAWQSLKNTDGRVPWWPKG